MELREKVEGEPVGSEPDLEATRARELRPSLTAEGPDSNIGRVLAARYRLDEFVAAGGMGRVYRGVQLQLDRVVAIKLLASSLMRRGDPKFIHRFNLEASISARLTHPNIVTVHDYGEDAGELFMAMEFLDGTSVARVITRDGPLGPVQALHVALQVAAGLKAAHSEGVVHRDLKPENLMLLHRQDEEGRDIVKILDFGLVKVFHGSDGGPGKLQKALEANLTNAGALLGSPRYMSPEQIADKAIDPRTDIYALGGILCFLLTGRAPFEGTNMVEILHQHLFVPLLPIDGVPDPIMAIIARCMEKEPDRRYPTMSEVIREIKGATKLITGESVETSGSSLPAFPALHRTELRSLPLPGAEEQSGPPAIPAAGSSVIGGVDVLAATMTDTSHPPPGPSVLVQVLAEPVGALTPPPFNAVAAREPATRSQGRPWLLAAVGLLAGLAVLVLYAAWPAANPPSQPAPALAAPKPPPPVEHKWKIISVPAGAKVMVEGVALGVTPLELSLAQAQPGRQVEVALDGYSTEVLKRPRDEGDLAVMLHLKPTPPAPRPAEAEGHGSPSRPAKARPSIKPRRPASPTAAEPAPDIRLAR